MVATEHSLDAAVFTRLELNEGRPNFFNLCPPFFRTSHAMPVIHILRASSRAHRSRGNAMPLFTASLLPHHLRVMSCGML